MRYDMWENAPTAASCGADKANNGAPFNPEAEDQQSLGARSLYPAAIHRSRRAVLVLILPVFWLLLSAVSVGAQGEKSYVGAEACKGCHEKEHTSFTTHSKMGNSFHSITRMRKGLTGEEIKKCYECHTTGYGRPGGFRSEAETPALRNLGCESCHGPGSSHASSGNPKEIKAHLEIKDCETCHARDRVAAFNYKPLLFGGAH